MGKGIGLIWKAGSQEVNYCASCDDFLSLLKFILR